MNTYRCGCEIGNPCTVTTMCKIQSVVEDQDEKIANIRDAFQEYVKSEGFSCRRDDGRHELAADKLGELLGFKRYSDDSGFDFYENDKDGGS